MMLSAHFRLFRLAPVWLLAIGLFAMAMQALGGIGLMPRSSGVGGFYAEICSSKGVGRVAAALPAGTTSLPDSGHQDCCKLCAASAPLLLTELAIGVPPAPTFSGVLLGSPFAQPFAHPWRLHPPRGPPAV